MEPDRAEIRPPGTPLSLAYLATYYPKITHRFIQREIRALEDCGVRIQRFATRPSPDSVPERGQEEELGRTRVLLNEGVVGMLASLMWAAATRPRGFLRAVALAAGAGWRSDRGLLVHFAYLAEASVLLRCFEKENVDHLHAHFATNTASIAMLCHAMGGPPYSFTAHGPDDFDRARQLGLEQKIARARFVLSVSYFGRSQLLRWCKYQDWSKIAVLSPGVDSAFLLPAVPVPAAPRLICVGRLHEQKGQLLLIEAVRQLKAEGVPCELVLVGEGPMRPEIERRIAEFHLQDCITLAGASPTDEMIALIQSSRALVLPSLAENLPAVILEAFALGRPVIATYIGGIPEVVEAGVSGWLAPAGRVECLVNAMREALSAPVSRLQEMGLKGSARVRSGHRSEVFAQRLLAMLRNVGEN